MNGGKKGSFSDHCIMVLAGGVKLQVCRMDAPSIQWTQGHSIPQCCVRVVFPQRGFCGRVSYIAGSIRRLLLHLIWR